MSKIDVYKTDDESKILKTRQDFVKKTRNKNSALNEKKYDSAYELTSCEKSNLEIAKADAEHSIDNSKALAAFLALFGGFLQYYILRGTEYSDGNTALIFRLIFFAPSAFFLLGVANEGNWLHVLKIAIALKSGLNSPTSPTIAPK